MDDEIGSLILHVHGAQCPEPHKHKDYVSSGAKNGREQLPGQSRCLGMSSGGSRHLGMLQTSIRWFLPLHL